MKNMKKLLSTLLCVVMIMTMATTAIASDTLDSASSWARDGIASALTKGFVPTDIQGNYTNVITRGEFCRMAIKWLEYATGKNIDTILSEKGLSRNQKAFSDTNDPDILAAFALSITGGTQAPTATSPGLFTPNGQFSREQAAAMVRNVCKAAGLDVSNTASAGFTDIGSASSWAVDGINYVRNNGIMGGTSTTPLTFSPNIPYTREQSIATFNNIKHSDSQASTEYPGFPGVPDFGIITGETLIKKGDKDKSESAYIYSFDSDQSKIKKYEEALTKNGYAFGFSTKSNSGIEYRFFRSNNDLHVGMGVIDGNFAVLLQDYKKKFKYYEKFPLVPDFAEFAGAKITTTEVEDNSPGAMLYTYYTNKNNENAVDEYLKTLALLNWKLINEADNGAELAFFLKKGDVEMLFMAQYPNQIHSIVTIAVADTKYEINDNNAGNNAAKKGDISLAEYEAWLLGDKSISDEAAYDYMMKNQKNAPQSGQGETKFTLQNTMKIPSSKGNVYQAPTELVLQFVNYVNISNPEKVKRGCTIQITSGKNALTGLWNSYSIDEDGKPGGTAFTTVDAVVVD